MTVYLGRDELLDLHLIAVERWGGRLGIRSQDRLLASLDAPRQRMFGTELYPSLADKVAVMAFQLIKHRPFHGGNEATALLVALRMLHKNAIDLDNTGVTALVMALRQVQDTSMGRDDLAHWIRERCLHQRYQMQGD